MRKSFENKPLAAKNLFLMPPKKNRKKKKNGAADAGGAVEIDSNSSLYFKMQGNTAFAAGDFELAVTEYGKVLFILIA